MKVLSLFDGMACGMIAMKLAGVPVEQYDAYEIDKYAVQAASHNFPDIKQHDDVFAADFTEYGGYDFLIGGSPCTYWSIAQSPDKRETTASGIGWQLFSQYVRALHEAKPRMFIYENNKSMSKDIRASITETFGFEPICINSALVSAQNRQRLYWVGVRQPDGTYRKASIDQPADRGILLKDVLDSAQPMQDKGYCVTATEHKGATLKDMLTKHRRTMAAEPIAACVASRGRNPDDPSDRTAGAPTEQRYEAHEDGKTNTITSVQKDNLIAEPVQLSEREMGYMTRDHSDRRWNHMQRPGEDEKGKCLTANTSKGVPYNVCAEPVATALQEQPFGRAKNENGEYDRRYEAKTDGKSAALTSVESRRIVAEPIRVGTMPRERDGVQTQGMAYRVYGEDGKSITLKGESGGGGGKSGLYALHEKPKKEQRVYTVQGGQIEVNGKRYPIKLKDGQYSIRKLTVSECKRLQTVPEWYDFSCVSNTQAYKMLGNGWTCEVIAHLIRGAIKSSITGV